MSVFVKNLIKCFAVLCIIAIAISFTYVVVKDEQEKEKRENLVWLARCELEMLRNDKEVQYLRLNEIAYEGNLLKLRYETTASFHEIEEKLKDSLMYEDFMSVIVLNPDKWETISQYLSEADVDLHITYLNFFESSFMISWEQLSQMLSDNRLLNEGIELFVRRKKQEVLGYARSHFRKDRYFTVDSLALSNDLVSLHLSYNDSRANLGHTFLDTSKVAWHYTDKVGDMGSILNNMLSICARTDRGFAFVYTAQKSHQVRICKYSAEKAKKIYEDTVDKLWLDKRETNRVRTIIYRMKQ